MRRPHLHQRRIAVMDLMITEVDRRIVVVAADHMATAGKLALATLVLAVTMVIVPQLIFSQTDLVRTLPANALGVFVWRTDSRLHEEVVRRAGNLRWRGLEVARLLSLPAHEFALIGKAEPWRVTLFINLKKPEGLTEFGRLRSNSSLITRSLGGGLVALANTQEDIEEALGEPLPISKRSLVRRALISGEGAIFSSFAPDVLRVSRSDVGLLAKGVSNEAPFLLSALLPVLEDHFPTSEWSNAELEPLLSILNEGFVDFAALGRLGNTTPPQKMVFGLFERLFPNGIRLINRKNESFVHF